MLDAEVPSTSTLQTDLLSESDLTDAFTQEGAADTLRGLAYGQAAAIQYTGYALMLASVWTRWAFPRWMLCAARS